MPRRAKTATRAQCAYCGALFETTRSDARFCPAPAGKRASPCQVSFGNLMAARGRVLAPYVMAWIAGKGGGHSGVNPTAAKAMRELTQIARGFIDEDKAKGRPSALLYMESLFAEGFLYCDRKRPIRLEERPPQPTGGASAE